jgi:hypothetical protein
MCQAASKKQLIDLLETKSFAVEAINAQRPGFRPDALLDSLDISPGEDVYVNWDLLETIDHMRLKDFADYFDDIWYSGPDDINAWSSEMTWILSISHEGYISVMT